MTVAKAFLINLGDLNYLQQQVTFPTIKSIRYDANGHVIYGYVDADGTTHELGEMGTFNPLEIINPDTGLPIYASARVSDGLRDTSGAYNALTQSWEAYGSSQHPFMRQMTHPDYNNYTVQYASNPAFTAAPSQTVDASDSNVIHNNGAYANPLTSVVDYTPRMISQTVTNSANATQSGPVDPATGQPSWVADNQAFAEVLNSDPAIAADGFVRNINTISGDPAYSGWFVLFGQFFDHGLDFIGKPSANATITIPLAPTDPLYGMIGPSGQPTYALKISRATVENVQGAGPDGKFYTADDINPGPDHLYGTPDDTIGPLAPEYLNHTSPMIDQSQTYGSNEQVTALLRQWVADPNHPGQYVPGAALFDGYTLSDDAAWHLPDGTLTHQTLPTLTELRQHVLATGRDDLTWDDINDYRARDAQGHLLDADGNAGNGVQVVRTGHALLLDMNPHFDATHITGLTKLKALDGAVDHLNFSAAAPFGFAVVYADHSTKTIMDFVDLATFTIRSDISATDKAIANELLLESVGDHYIAGDGRANENFGLTAIHHVFHEDHNVQLLNLEGQILKQNLADPTHNYAHTWQIAVTASGPASGAGVTIDANNHYVDANNNYVTSAGAISWNNDRLFQGTKLIVEMEYQHVAIDQYARLITPDLPEFVTYDSAINADISLEYGQAAFRFGHSQLRDTIDAIEKDASGEYDLTGAITHYGLAQSFLSPQRFADVGPTAVALGMTRQVGSETDEFVTPAVQQSLLGQPLDLPAINIARARDLGLPTLNQTRQQIHDALIAERAANPDTPHHTNIVVDALTPYTSWSDFANNMIHPESLANFIAAYAFDGDVSKANALLGLDRGTVAEGSAEAMGFTQADATNFLNGAKDPVTHAFLVDGASAFNNIDLWLGGLAEKHVYGGILGPTFNAIFEDQMERLMDGDRFYYLYRLDLALPITTDLNQEITTEQFKDIIERTTDARHLNGDVMTFADSYVELSYNASSPSGNAFKTEHKYGYLIDSYATSHAGEHLGVYSTGGAGGTNGNGTIIHLTNADTGDTQGYFLDYRPDIGTNPDGTTATGYNSHEVVSGTAYNDWIDAGDGDDTIYGGAGNDVLDGKSGADHIYGEAGDDVIYGGDIEDFLDGGDGNQIIYAGTSAGAIDVVIGGRGNDHLYGEAGIDELHGGDGDDYIDAGGDTDVAFGDAGNDEMYGGDGPDELRGGTGDDILSGGSGPDMLKGEGGDDIIMGGIGGGAAQGDGDEALGGDGFDFASFADSTLVLDVAADLNNQNLVAAPGTNPPFEPFGMLVSEIEGLIGSKFADKLLGDGGDNWLVGGSANDTLRGAAGNDVIIGDSIRLDVLDGHWHKSYDVAGNPILTQDSQGLLGTQGMATHLSDLLTSRPNYVLGETNAAGSGDTAVYSGNLDDYTVTKLFYDTATGTLTTSTGPGVITAYKIADHRPGSPDGTDLVIGVEKFQFADGVFSEALVGDHRPTGPDPVVLAALNENAARTITTAQLLQGWSDLDLDPMSVQNLTASSGNLIDNNNGTWSFTPVLNDDTGVAFTYKVSDGLRIVDAHATLDLIPQQSPSTGGVHIAPTYGQTTNTATLTATNDLADPDVATLTVTYQWQSSSDGTTWANVAGATKAAFTPASGQVGKLLHVVGTYTDPFGTYSFTSPETAVVGDSNGNSALSGTSGVDLVLGLGGNDTLNGLGGNDTLDGAAGNDTLDGGTGNDKMLGGAGNDTYFVDSALDVVTETAGGGTDTVNSSITYTLGANLENLTLLGSAAIDGTGNTLDNTLTGNSGINKLTGGAGNDTYFVQNTGDMVIETAGQGTDLVNSSVSFTLGVNVENLTLTGSAAIDGTGNTLDNTITGNSGINKLTGGAGNDTYFVQNTGDTVVENAA
ncbi:MAG: heme peroxidase [Rhodospirillales bacterium]|nr:heme peroxidase [Rhodospirillales bacterium]